ncbi:TetR/AcrR family transcriptional regulator [Bacillus aquiflavi]|uniref:TetR/AcrR family transcriptional regulator n=1 Tax=Bacillus aquiflavi TaxID=2672567 RepID=A0A6B3W2F4_9BACI|nr:helix-turn-helix domain-containing protein [Bacillus aquiflavi]MBA4536961.1 TetR/AcrR family transcriptional regulator [Bacillus aquiflavi]NEY82657.1 TetR/AcrR family transcriptional regulator [Bacillus aquiflavi]UAC47776.1 TetR/AcrR family transcriptional regulator [Bacillus aquiflavi]
MRDKTEQILKAAIAVFIKKGLQATTQEIAKEADVAEVTLFRKFSTKQNLFKNVIKHVIENQFNPFMMEIAAEEDTEVFLTKIIKNRLEILSKNIPLVKMLISESLMGNLTDEIDFPNIIFFSLKKGLDRHFENKGDHVNTELCARQLGGIFLSQIILPNEKPYYRLNEQEKNILAKTYAQSVISVINER